MKTEKKGAVGSSILNILQPSDSARVAEAIITKIEEADFDVAFAAEKAVLSSFSEGLTCPLGDAVVSAIEDQVGRAMRGCLGSYEMGQIVFNAIREGIEGIEGTTIANNQLTQLTNPTN